MSILDNIRSFELDKNRNKQFRIKSAIVWGIPKNGRGQFPLFYISKQKWMTKEEFDLILEKLDISMRR